MIINIGIPNQFYPGFYWYYHSFGSGQVAAKLQNFQIIWVRPVPTNSGIIQIKKYSGIFFTWLGFYWNCRSFGGGQVAAVLT
jgi:hypothetical protein